jgi:Tfp pilus assembly protein PilV
MKFFSKKDKVGSGTRAGFTLVEAIIGVAIIVLLLSGIIALYTKYVQAFSDTADTITAQYLLEEGMEVTRLFRDNSWSNSLAKFSTTTPVRFTFSTSTSAWATTTANVFIQGVFDRYVTVSDVRRHNTTKDITSSVSGSAYDPNTKLVTVTVAWKTSTATTTKSISGYLSNIFSN